MTNDLINATLDASARAASDGRYEDAATLLTASNVLDGFEPR